MEFSTAINVLHNGANQLGKVGEKLTKAKRTVIAQKAMNG